MRPVVSRRRLTSNRLLVVRLVSPAGSTRDYFRSRDPYQFSLIRLIYAAYIDQDAQRIDIDMTLTAPGCGMGPVLVGDVEYRLSLVPHVKKVEVNLVFDPPWSRDMMSEEAQFEAGVFF